MRTPKIFLSALLLFTIPATSCTESSEDSDHNNGVWGYELNEELGCVSMKGEPTLYLGATEKPSSARGTSQTCLINLNDGRIVFPDRFVEVDTSDGAVLTAHDGLENWRTCSSVGQIRPPFCESCAENVDDPDPNYGVWGYVLDEELGCVSMKGEPALYLGATEKPSSARGTSQTCLINLNDGRIVFPDRFVEVDLSDGAILTAHDGLENWRTCSSVGQIRPPFCESLEAEEPVEEEPLEEPVEEDPTDPQ